MENTDFWEAVRKIQERDSRFKTGLYPFVMEALEYTIQRIGERRHVSAGELLDGVCGYARTRFGFLAHEVLENWGIAGPMDVGLAVYQLVDAGVLSRQDEDQLEDFDLQYNLREQLERDYLA